MVQKGFQVVKRAGIPPRLQSKRLRDGRYDLLGIGDGGQRDKTGPLGKRLQYLIAQ